MGKINNKLICLIFLSSCLNNFKFTNFGGRGILFPEILIFIFILLNIRKIMNVRNIIIIFMILVLIPIFNFYTIIDFKEFLLTYISLAFYVIFVLIIRVTHVEKEYINAFRIGLMICAIYGIFQFIYSFVFGGNELIHKPFGNNTSIITYYTHIGKFYRSNSLYYEPSIFGLYSALGLAISFKSKKKSDTILFTIAILVSMSGVAYIALVLMYLIKIFTKKYRNICSAYIISIISIINVFLVFKFYLTDRLLEFSISGSTAFYRILSPIYAIKEMFYKGNFFGLAYGNVPLYIKSYNLPQFNVYGVSYSAIDNIPALIILYCGIFSVPLIFLFSKFILRNTNLNNIYFVTAFILLSLGTGGLNFVYFNMALAMLIIIFKLDSANLIDKNNGSVN